MDDICLWLTVHLSEKLDYLFPDASLSYFIIFQKAWLDINLC